MNIMSDENNLNDSKQGKQKENPFANFVSGIKSGFESLQKSIEEQAQKNKELWDKNKEKTKQFFQKAKENWDNKIKKAQEDMQKAQGENKAAWDAPFNKLKADYDNWQEKVREDWKDGIKEINKWSSRAYVRFLLYTIPFIIILVIIFSVIGPYLPKP